ncbi:hypothetical protein MSAN_00630700 [Mycena sanguinolenta]|uniref:SWIM-type domain-containing protein n=1 Tax=Mycena sanguinolenta TaxID=230812 RepID=A0A8H6Z377_9AGAR|nr:hypothetical protein MSAN_00630700 [Mycena sanguinolenta]
MLGLSPPPGATTWAEAAGPQDTLPCMAPQAADEAERVMLAAEEVLNPFTDDTIRISAQFMLRLIEDRGWVCSQLFKTSHYASATLHFIAVLDNGPIICDCMMGTNLGIPCRHFYTPLRSFRSGNLVTFHLGLFNPKPVKFQSFDRGFRNSLSD